ALGTVADLVPLQDENRIFVKRGLAQLARSRWVGLNALIEIAGLRAPFKPADVGFGLGPRLNAAGRLGTAQDSLELLLTEDPSRARTLANSLDQQNRDRRAVEEGVLVEAEAQLVKCFRPERDAAIVVGAAGWHPGVVGIVASRLLRRYHRPTLVVAIDAEGMGKGSGRSIHGFSLVESLGRCAHLIERFGGHEMAAGLTLRGDRLPEFREAFCACAREMLSDDQLEPSLRLDAELSLGEIGLDLLAEYESLQPFGAANPEPIFFARGVTPVADPRVLKEKHLSFLFRQGSSKTKAIWFNGAAGELPQPPWDVAFTIDRNEWQGYPSAQLYIKAVRAAG
ncbi:MAG: DHHA1 domain-containing protein, partial [Chthoniobacteraceae bacterium]